MAEELTPAWWIHNRYYLCQVRNVDLSDREETKYGYRRAGVSALDDQEYALQMRPAQLTIMDMAEIYDNGGKVALNNPRDAIEICEKVQSHLESWNRALEERLTLPGKKGDVEKVLDDLVKLDAIQYHFHQMAMRYYNEGVPRLVLEQHLAGRSRRGLNLSRVAQATSEEESGANTQYTPMADSLKLKALKRKNNRWQ